MTFNSIIIRTAYVLIFCIKARAEKEVSFDNGPESSIAEDAYFGLLAASKGFTFGFIEGEMWEKSPFTILDFLRQRKRWIQGLLLVTHSANIPIGYNSFQVKF